MIPKVIHWCWLSDSYPELIEKCIQTWKKFCPDYEIIRWDLKKSDLANLPKWCKVAYDNKVYAFISDYIRAKALYEYGGIYLDSDVCLCKPQPFKDYENDKLWIPMEDVGIRRAEYYNDTLYITGKALNPVFMGARPEHKYFKYVMDRYWTLDDNYAIKGSNMKTYVPIAPAIFSKEMENFGFKYINKEQYLKEGIHILSSEKFNHLGDIKNKNNVNAIHLARNSWVNKL